MKNVRAIRMSAAVAFAWTAAVGLALSIGLTCSVEAAEKEPGKSGELRKVTVAFVTVGGSSSILLITKDAGLFEKYGLDVQPLYLPGVRSTQSLLSGDSHLAFISGRTVTTANLAGADLVAIGSAVGTLVFSLYTPKEIQKLEELKGKSVAVTQIGGSADFAIRYGLKRVGLTADKDVAIFQTGGMPESLAALQSRKIQGAVLSPPTTIKAGKLGLKELLDFSEMGLPYAQAIIAVKKSYIARNREAVDAFTKGLVEGIHYAKTHKEFSKKTIGKYIRSTDDAVLEDTYNIFLDKHLPRIPYVSEESIQTVLDEMAPQVPKVKEIKPAMYIDNGFLKKVVDSGLIKQLYGN